ncbi:DUF4396 domain-containing protein [Aeromicrobium stalagmiti]|uniref:DUF4396 domain-containing protein n=1 Tax=Aeromicrobium stalagmiti TaxID=2738988 RepID=UPI0015687714|nr:DUF4396 domain-containing protein [Aeromicrobium stalagmiti]NRQ51729.1 DUF4396 domain-containing protein [Aeromicrobium stalagmiti]
MNMTNNVPDWLTPIAWGFIALAVLSAVLIAADIYGRGRRHRTIAAELVWVCSALYLGPVALWLYGTAGRARTRNNLSAQDTPASSATVSLPGGAASAVAHLIGVPLVLASGLTIAGIDLWVMLLVIGALAMVLLFTFERTSVTGLSAVTAAGAAVMTVLAFDIGMAGWMLLLHFTEYMPPASEGSFWFLMQIGIVLGLVTGYPVAAALARRNKVTASAIIVA